MKYTIDSLKLLLFFIYGYMIANMKNAAESRSKLHPSLDREFLVLCTIILIILLSFSLLMGMQTYKNQKSIQTKELLATLATVENSLDTSLTKMSDFLQYIGDQVLSTYDGKPESAVHLFKHNFSVDTKLDNFFSWTQLSWINTRDLISIAPEGILAKGKEYSKNYPLVKARENPWILTIGSPSVRDNYTYLPVAMSIHTDENIYLGTIISDILTEKLQRDINEALGLSSEAYEFVIWDNNGQIIVNSPQEQTKHPRYEDIKTLVEKDKQALPIILKNTDGIIDRYSIANLTFYISVIYTPTSPIMVRFLNDFLPNIYLPGLLTLIFLLLIYLFRKRTILPVINKLQINLAAETAVRKEKDRFLTQILGGITGFLYRHMINGDNIITEYVSDGCSQLTGYTPEQYFGVNRIKHSDVIHPDYQAQVLDHIKNLIIKGEPFELSYPIITSKGDIKWVLNQGHPIPSHSQDKDTMLFEGLLTDITEMKNTQQKMEKAFEALKLSNAELEEFSYACSHDLKEPLRTIFSYIKLYQREGNPEYLSYIETSTLRMKNLIENILLYSQIGINASKKEEIVDLEDVLASTMQMMQGAILETRATITTSSLGRVIGDKEQLQRLFQNLLSNAIKFHSTDSPKIHIGGQLRGNMWELFIKDNGIGIASEYHKKVFNLFEKLHSRDLYQGNGIGLTLCKKIVERHGGTIRVESELNQGSTFFLTLVAAT